MKIHGFSYGYQLSLFPYDLFLYYLNRWQSEDFYLSTDLLYLDSFSSDKNGFFNGGDNPCDNISSLKLEEANLNALARAGAMFYFYGPFFAAQPTAKPAK